MSSLSTRKPLCVGKDTNYYSVLYTNDHKEFCRRFVDTVLIQHFDKFINLCITHNIDSIGIQYKFIDTDAFLWAIRDLLDDFLTFKTVRDIVFDKKISMAIEQMFLEIKKEYLFIQSLFIDKI
jgi:hypothetical protein